MGSPISPGDVLTLAQGVYKLCKKFKDAPEEMMELAEHVGHVKVTLGFFKTQASQLEFLKSPDGKELSDDLDSHLRKLKRLLKDVKSIAKQWRKARKNFLRKLPFIFYTMRAVPDLRKGLHDQLEYVDRDRELALQAGVNLGPQAQAQMRKIVAEELKRAKANEKSDKSTVDDAERKRHAATSALKRVARSQKPASVVDMKKEAEKELKDSGLSENESKMLSDLLEKELQSTDNQKKLTEIREKKGGKSDEKTPSKGTPSVKSGKSWQSKKAGTKPKQQQEHKSKGQEADKTGKKQAGNEDTKAMINGERMAPTSTTKETATATWTNDKMKNWIADNATVEKPALKDKGKQQQSPPIVVNSEDLSSKFFAPQQGDNVTEHKPSKPGKKPQQSPDLLNPEDLFSKSFQQAQKPKADSQDNKPIPRRSSRAPSTKKDTGDKNEEDATKKEGDNGEKPTTEAQDNKPVPRRSNRAPSTKKDTGGKNEKDKTKKEDDNGEKPKSQKPNTLPTKPTVKPRKSQRAPSTSNLSTVTTVGAS